MDARPQNSLTLAKIEHDFGIKGTYNFRVVPQSWNEEIILKISDMGHEIGYHYEELSTYTGNSHKAFEAFKKNLEKLRKLTMVTTICMHGSPRSRHDSRELWEQFDYKKLNIIGEPYFDIDFSKVLYLTDTGRRWDGERVSIRDQVNPEQKNQLKQKGFVIRRSQDIIKAAKSEALPEHIMITIHPQRWHNQTLSWIREWVTQNLKNIVKHTIIRLRQ